MMIEKIITKNNQDFQYFSESELTELRNEFRSLLKRPSPFYPGDPRNHLILLVSGVIKIEKMIAVVIFLSAFYEKAGSFSENRTVSR